MWNIIPPVNPKSVPTLVNLNSTEYGTSTRLRRTGGTNRPEALDTAMRFREEAI